MIGSEIANLLYRLADEQNGRNVEIALGGQRYTVIQHAGDAEYLLRTNIANYEKSVAWLSHAIGPSRLTENGEAWESRLKLTQRHIAKCDLERLFALGRKHGERGIAALLEKSEAGAERMDDGLFRLVTSGVMVETLLNRTWSDFGFTTYAEISEVLQYAVDYSFSTAGYAFDPTGRRLPMSRERTSAFFATRRFIMERLSSIRPTITADDPVLWDLLQHEAVDPTFRLEHEILMLLTAGSETSAAAIGWGCYLLAREPELQEELRSEVQAFWRSPNPDLAGLQRLHRFRGFVVDALRMFPPAPVTAIRALGEDRISDRPVAPGETMFISLVGLNHDRTTRPYPWRVEIESPPSAGRGDTMTFSIGPRMCSGRHFATTEVITALAVFIDRARFELTSTAPLDFLWCFSLNPRNGHPVRAVRL